MKKVLSRIKGTVPGRSVFLALLPFLLFFHSCDGDTVIIQEGQDSDAALSWLYVQTAPMGSLEVKALQNLGKDPLEPYETLYTLTLNDVSRTVAFADHPYRESRTLSTGEFTRDWQNGLYGFLADPPNAALEISGGQMDRNVLVVTLEDPVYAGGSLTYTLRPQEPGEWFLPRHEGRTAHHWDFPLDFEEVSLFIDSSLSAGSCNLPAPGSYATKKPIAYSRNNSPFSASVGICQETDNQTPQQLSNISANFKMIHIYRYNQEALDKAMADNMEVLLGTDKDVAASFAASLQNAEDYVDQKVAPYAQCIKAIALGNEPNLTGVTRMEHGTFETAMANLTTALKNKSLDIPATVTLTWGGTVEYSPPDNVLFRPDGDNDGPVYSPRPYIRSVAAHNAKPFVFFDFYPRRPLDSGAGTLAYCLFEEDATGLGLCGMFDAQYLSAVNATSEVDGTVEVYVSEVGWPYKTYNYATPANQATFINNFFTCWTGRQNRPTIPVFLFYAYGNVGFNEEFALFQNQGINFANYRNYTGR